MRARPLWGLRLRRVLGALALALLVLGAAWAARRPPRARESVFGLSPTRPAGGALVPAERLGNSDYCGACHTDVFHQWNSSAHHFSSFNNPFYRHVALHARERRGPDAMKLCAGCHDPLPLLAGELDQLDTGAFAANAGITCLACHRISEVHGRNGDYRLATPLLDAFVLTETPLLRPLHSAFVRALPVLHRAELSRPLHRQPEYCGTCHSLTPPKAVNGAGDLTIQDDYGQWLAGPYSAHGGALGRRDCIACHMPLVRSDDPAARDGLIRSHRFLGGNTALPALNRDDAQLEATVDFLRAHAPRLTIASLRVTGRVVEARVEVSNERVGHGFPGGTAESNEVWLEFELHDATGRQVFVSGERDATGDVAPGAVFLRAEYLDARGQPTTRGTTATEAVRKGGDATLAPRQSRAFDYRIALAAPVRLPLRARVRLNWRKFAPAFARDVFAQRPVAELPVTVLAEAAESLERAAALDAHVSAAAAPPNPGGSTHEARATRTGHLRPPAGRAAAGRGVDGAEHGPRPEEPGRRHAAERGPRREALR